MKITKEFVKRYNRNHKEEKIIVGYAKKDEVKRKFFKLFQKDEMKCPEYIIRKGVPNTIKNGMLVPMTRC